MAVGLGLGLAGIGLAAQGIGAIQANKDRKRAQAELDKLSSQPYAKYSISPQTASYYSRVLSGVTNPQGMTPAERAAAQSGINTALNTQRYNVAGASGGNLSRYISGALNNQAANAQNQLAMRDAQMRQQNQMQNLGMLGQAASQYQNIDNLNTAQELNRRMLTEQALGQSVLQNKAYGANFLNTVGSDLLGGGLMLGLGGGVTQVDENGVPFAGIRNRFTPRNTNYSVDPSILNTNPLQDYRTTRTNLNQYR